MGAHMLIKPSGIEGLLKCHGVVDFLDPLFGNFGCEERLSVNPRPS